jgi:hypothetical protein
MIDVTNLRARRLADIAAGNLLVFIDGGDPRLALCIQGVPTQPGPMALALKAPIDPRLFQPHVYQMNSYCLDFGVPPVFVWEDSPSVLKMEAATRQHVGNLFVTENEVAIGGSFGSPSRGDSSAWNIRTGALVDNVERSLCLTHWRMGVVRHDNTLEVLLRFPEDYVMK